MGRNLEEIYSYFEIELPELLHKLPLGEADKSVGIYEMGKHTECFLKSFQMDVGPIKAKVIFIDSSKKRNHYLKGIRDMMYIM